VLVTRLRTQAMNWPPARSWNWWWSFQRGDYAEAEPYLQDFLRYYEPNDGWRRNAEAMLSEVPGPGG
jgi:hypothetical protein